jgi:hypothetical protein
MNDLVRTQRAMAPAATLSWTKSLLSHANNNCVEVADLPDGQVGMRDSKDIIGPVLRFRSDEWRAFLHGVRNGEFDSFAT